MIVPVAVAPLQRRAVYERIERLPDRVSTPATRGGTYRRDRVPTPRLVEGDLRENLPIDPLRWPGIMGGERLATDNRQVGYTRWKAFPSDRVPFFPGRGGYGSGTMDGAVVLDW